MGEEPRARGIEPFDKTRHRREDFSCGVEALDPYFRIQAGQDAGRNVAAVFVLAEGSSVLGYYTLSAYTIDAGELPAEIGRKLKLPRYPRLPAVLLGRLAMDRRYQKQGLGEMLLVDALRRALASTAAVAAVAVVVEAESDRAHDFYVPYGFMPFPSHRRKLFVPMRAVERILFSPVFAAPALNPSPAWRMIVPHGDCRGGACTRLSQRAGLDL